MNDSPNLPFAERVKVWGLPHDVEDAILAEVDTSAHEAEVAMLTRDAELTYEQLSFSRDLLKEILSIVDEVYPRYTETKKLIADIKQAFAESLAEI
jgi:hypothetical protein